MQHQPADSFLDGLWATHPTILKVAKVLPTDVQVWWEAFSSSTVP